MNVWKYLHCSHFQIWACTSLYSVLYISIVVCNNAVGISETSVNHVPLKLSNHSLASQSARALLSIKKKKKKQRHLFTFGMTAYVNYDPQMSCDGSQDF